MHREYRGDIQVYRALAVSLVLAFHLGVSGASSGFLGVDIFFVISGYLMQKLHSEGDTALAFYGRRARRLLPAYLVTVLATLLAGYVITLPSEFRQVAEQAIFAGGFASNIGFWMQNSYFSKDEFNPLLHLWSLGVEIQFYLLFPLIAWLCRGRRWLVVLMVAGSLALCLMLVTISPKTAFFMLPARLWQFGLGMLAATLALRRTRWAGILGLAGMVLVPLMPVDGQSLSFLHGHPGLAAIAVSACAALALAGRLPAALVDSRPGRVAQRLGNASYALYLAHWPVLVYLHYQPFSGTITSGGGIAGLLTGLLLITVATWTLHFGFERPGLRFYTSRRAATLAAAVIAAALVLPGLHLQGFPPEQRPIFAAWQDRAPYRCGKLSRVTSPSETFCTLGRGVGERHVALVGDSHADALKMAFADAADRAGFITHFPVPNGPLITPAHGLPWLLARVSEHPIEAVFLHFASPNLDAATIAAAAAALGERGIDVVLLGPVPVHEGIVPRALYEHVTTGRPLPSLTLADHDARNPEADRIRSAGVEVIDTAPLLCTPVCALASADGRPFYSDGSHLTLTGAAVLEEVIYGRLAAIGSGAVQAAR